MCSKRILFKTILICLFTLLPLVNTVEANDNQFASEKWGLLTSRQSQDVTDNLLMGLGGSSDIRSYVPKAELNKFVSFFNSGSLMTSFPINKEIGDAYLMEVSNEMSSLGRINFVKEFSLGMENEPDGGVMTLVSLVSTSDDKTIIEVAIVAFDWKKASAKKTGMKGVRESVIWHSVSRKILPIASKGILNNWGEEPQVRFAYSQLVKSNFKFFLTSF